VFALKKSRVVDRGVRARRGTERVDETRVDEKRAWVPYWYCLSHGSSWLYITTTTRILYIFRGKALTPRASAEKPRDDAS